MLPQPYTTAHSLCSVHNWLDGAMLAIYTPIGMCGDLAPGGRMHKISTNFN